MHFCVIGMNVFSKNVMNLIQLRWYQPTPLAHGLVHPAREKNFQCEGAGGAVYGAFVVILYHKFTE